MSAEELPTAHPVAPRPPRSTGRDLTLLGLTPDGARLRLADTAGAEYVVEVDARLRAALSGRPATTPSSPAEPGSPGTPSGTPSGTKVETQMDSMLRPRDIQARIRSGETPEQVAAAAQTSLERVMPYAAPVLAEREHVAERAQRSSIRRASGEGSGPSRTLGDAITAHLHERNVDPELVAWDAWRREDGRWAVAGRYSVHGREGLAELTFDQPGNFVVLDNDDARWLVGDLPDPAPVAPTAEEPADEGAPVRRLAAVRETQPQAAYDEDQLTLGDDVLGLVSPDQPVEAFLDDQPGLDESALVEEAADAAALDPDPDSGTDSGPAREHDPAAEEPAARRPVKKSRGRASVPSWDEIMFGGGPEQ